MMRYGYGFDMMNGGWWGGLLTLLFGVLIIAGIVLIIVWAVRQSSGHTTSGPTPPRSDAGHDEAVAIARKRLAAGDITKEQYDELIRALG